MEIEIQDYIENTKLHPDEIYERENNTPSQIIRNILVGETISNPLCEQASNKRARRHIGSYILDALKSSPNFIGQIDAKTGRKVTFEEMRDKSVKCAIWLKKQQRICCDNVITVCTMNQLDAYVPFLAGLYIGCKVNPLDEYLVKGNLDYFLEKVKPKVIFVSASFAMATLQFACQVKGKCKNATLPKIVVFDHHEVFESLHSILQYNLPNYNIDNFSCPVISIRNTAIILFSSGTDGHPKDVDIPQSVFMAPSDQQAPFMRLGDTALWFESFGFITGMFLTIRAIISRATAIKAKPIFHAKEACRLIETYKVTWMFLKTDMCAELVKSLDLAKYDVSSLKNVLFGGSIVNHEIHANLIKSFPNASVIQVYSLTETGIIAYQRKTGEVGSCGYVGKNIRLMITSLYPSAKTIPLGPNAQGQIWCRSPYMMRKYYSNATHDVKYCEKWMTSWFNTGDVGYYDKDGNVFVTERISQIFKYKKKTISPIEIESVLQNHPAVLEAVVVPVPYAVEDEFPKAFITKIPGKEVTEEELERWVTERLGTNKDLRGGVIFPQPNAAHLKWKNSTKDTELLGTS